MGCKIFITLVIVGILQLHTLNALPVESAPAAPAPPCTLQEATEINQKHLQDGENRVNEINIDAAEVLDDIHEEIEKLFTDKTVAGQELLTGLQTTLNQEIQSKPESIDCLSAIQIQVDIASAKSSYNLAKCSTKTQKKGLELKNKITKAQMKVEAIKNKAVTSIGKCAIIYYPYGSCADLDSCCELEKTKALLKVDKYANKVKHSAEEIVLEVDECLSEALQDAQKYVLYINLNILNCSSAQPIILPAGSSDESGESDEFVGLPGLPLGPQGPQQPEGPQGPQGPQQPEGSQDPQQPEGPQGPQQPEGTQDPQQPEGSQDPQQPEGSQGPQQPEGTQDPQQPEGPQGPQGPKNPEEPQDSQTPVDSQGPKHPEESQGTGQPEEPPKPQEPQDPQTPVDAQEPQNPEKPQETQQPQEPQGAQDPQTPEETQGTEIPLESQTPQESQTTVEGVEPVQIV